MLFANVPAEDVGLCGLLAIALAEAVGSGEDDNRRDGSTGGRGRCGWEEKWLTWKPGSSGVLPFKLYELDGRCM